MSGPRPVGRVRGWLSSIASVVARRLDPDRSAAAIGSAGQRHISPLAIEGARRSATVTSCIDTLARTVGQCTFEAPDSPANGAINRALQHRPNPYQTPVTFWHGLVEDLMYEGNSVTRVFRESGLTLAPLDPQRITVQPDEAGLPRYWAQESTELLSGGEGGDAIHVRDGGGHEIWAQSRLSKAAVRIIALIEADALIRSTFRGGVHVNHVVQTDRVLGDGGRKLADEIRAEFGASGDRQGGIVVLEHAELKPVQGLKPADADLRALRQDLIREIAAEFGVPPFKVGGTGDTKYSNYTASMLSFYRDSVLPITANIAQAFALSLGTAVVARTAPLLEGDMQTQVELAVAGSGGPVWTPNEARATLHLEPVDDGNELRASAPIPEPDREGEMPSDDGATDADEEVGRHAITEDVLGTIREVYHSAA